MGVYMLFFQFVSVCVCVRICTEMRVAASLFISIRRVLCVDVCEKGVRTDIRGWKNTPKTTAPSKLRAAM